jgi:hypothetical protein
MHTLAIAEEAEKSSGLAITKSRIEAAIDKTITTLPKVEALSENQRRGIIARYTSVLEGNFIYWMTAALLSVRCEEAKPVIIDNLTEEVRDSHPAMLRRFAIAAGALPTREDALAVNEDLTRARLFFGKLRGVPTLAAMAFFEGFIQRFMAYLADLALAQGSNELVYTDVHGVCDIAHTEGLYQALSAELAVDAPSVDEDTFEGVDLLQTLLARVIYGEVSVA